MFVSRLNSFLSNVTTRLYKRGYNVLPSRFIDCIDDIYKIVY